MGVPPVIIQVVDDHDGWYRLTHGDLEIPHFQRPTYVYIYTLW